MNETTTKQQQEKKEVKKKTDDEADWDSGWPVSYCPPESPNPFYDGWPIAIEATKPKSGGKKEIEIHRKETTLNGPIPSVFHISDPSQQFTPISKRNANAADDGKAGYV